MPRHLLYRYYKLVILECRLEFCASIYFTSSKFKNLRSNSCKIGVHYEKQPLKKTVRKIFWTPGRGLKGLMN